MATTIDTGVDYFRTTAVLTLDGSSSSLSILELGMLGATASGTSLLTTTSVAISTAGTDNLLTVGEAFTMTTTSTTLGVETTSSVELTLLGSGTFASTDLFTGTANILYAVDGNGNYYIVFPDGDMPSGLLGSVLGSVATVITVDDVGYNFTTGSPLCFARGAMIDTPSGRRAIEDIRVGDLVLTRDHGPQPVRWIGVSRVLGIHFMLDPRLRPVRIRAGSLGPGVPESDLTVSPQHRMLVRSTIVQRMFEVFEILVPARQLLQVEGVETTGGADGIEYYHMLFDAHEVVRANGAETETLHTGPEALKALGEQGQREVFSLFPELADAGHARPLARTVPTGRMARKMAERHVRNRKMLIGAV